MLTQKDFDQIEELIDNRLEDKFPSLSAKIDKILTLLSGFAGDVKNLQDEQTVQGGQIEGHEKRITTLENS